ncbi:MAG: vitamin K epoxide reductase family protein, partial [Phycisphaerales bacterium]|nr:vitamin K epoxide reductase family protein [Phycisphaerales bacterium]
MPRRLEWFVAILAALIGLGVSGVLLFVHLRSIALPGCGSSSPCALALGRWGRLPFLDWPVAMVGVSYFASVLGGLACGNGSGAILRWLTRAGGLVSVGLVFFMIAVHQVCLYCLAVHLASVVLSVAHEGVRRRPAKVQPAIAFVTGVATLVTLLLVEAGMVRATRREAAETLREDEARLRTPEAGPAFTGRYRLGPSDAAARIVLFTDYRCPDCRAV